MMRTENDTLMEIVHLASAALVADLSEVKRQALGDIYEAIASILPVDHAAKDKAADDPDRLKGLEKFHTVAPGVKLVRFAGPDEVRLLARRKGRDATPNAVFEIEVLKHMKCASVTRDGKTVFDVQGYGTNASVVEQLAVAGLRQYLKQCARRNSRRRRREKARSAAKRAAEGGAA